MLDVLIMDSKKDIKLILTIGFLFTISLYHLANYFIKPVSEDLYVLLKIVQITVLAITFFLLIYSPIVVKIFFRKKYIAGKYKGDSKRYRDADKESYPPKVEIETFTVSQNLFDTRISGKSFNRDTNELVSIWTGSLFKVDGNTFHFAIELSTEKGEFGILKATFENEEVHGFYYSGEPKINYAFSFSAKKVVI